MDAVTLAIRDYTIIAMQWAAPWWFVWMAASLFTLSLFNILPLRVPALREDEYGFVELIQIGTRRAALYSIAFLVILFVPLAYLGTAMAVAPDPSVGHAWFVDYVSRQSLRWGWLLPLGAIAGVAIRITWSRNGVVWWSQIIQRFRAKQEDHQLSDIRVEVGRLRPKQFVPRDHYTKGQIFLGLGQDGAPTYLPLQTFKETHMQVVGPTRFGKGVLLGALLEQAIHGGHAVVYIDPKADKFAPYIMAEACAATGRKFVYIDLNSEDTKWAPFEGGSERDRRSRIVNCFGLNNTGDGSDFYKSKERAILDTILPKAGSSIAGLRSALEMRGDDGKPLKESANRLADGLTEFAALPSLNPKKGGGNKIGEALKAGAAIYVRGSLDDPTVKRATQVMITEIIQEARRLAPERTSHLTFAVDELKFMISQEICDALATIAGFNVNMILLHQSIKDLRAPEDRSLNVQALESGVLVNCQVKLMYRASDPETAEWASKLSGTKIVRTTKSQVVEHNRFGGEKYGTDRTVSDVEVPVITMNEMLSLSPRVGVFYVPERLASILFTCFVPADTTRVLYTKPKPPTAPEPGNDAVQQGTTPGEGSGDEARAKAVTPSSEQKKALPQPKKMISSPAPAPAPAPAPQAPAVSAKPPPAAPAGPIAIDGAPLPTVVPQPASVQAVHVDKPAEAPRSVSVPVEKTSTAPALPVGPPSPPKKIVSGVAPTVMPKPTVATDPAKTVVRASPAAAHAAAPVPRQAQPQPQRQPQPQPQRTQSHAPSQSSVKPVDQPIPPVQRRPVAEPARTQPPLAASAQVAAPQTLKDIVTGQPSAAGGASVAPSDAAGEQLTQAAPASPACAASKPTEVPPKEQLCTVDLPAVSTNNEQALTDAETRTPAGLTTT